MLASCERAFGDTSLKGRTVAVVGLGSVGLRLAKLRRPPRGEARRRPTSTSASARRPTSSARAGWRPTRRSPPRSTSWRRARSAACSTRTPCPRLQAPVDRRRGEQPARRGHVADRLAQRGILWAPDFVANAGGIINISVELEATGYDAKVARAARAGDRRHAARDLRRRRGRDHAAHRRHGARPAAPGGAARVDARSITPLMAGRRSATSTSGSPPGTMAAWSSVTFAPSPPSPATARSRRPPRSCTSPSRRSRSRSGASRPSSASRSSGARAGRWSSPPRGASSSATPSACCAEVDGLHSELEELTGLLSGQLRIGGVYPTGPYDLFGMLADFRARAPGRRDPHGRGHAGRRPRRAARRRARLRVHRPEPGRPRQRVRRHAALGGGDRRRAAARPRPLRARPRHLRAARRRGPHRLPRELGAAAAPGAHDGRARPRAPQRVHLHRDGRGPRRWRARASASRSSRARWPSSRARRSSCGRSGPTA